MGGGPALNLEIFAGAQGSADKDGLSEDEREIWAVAFSLLMEFGDRVEDRLDAYAWSKIAIGDDLALLRCGEIIARIDKLRALHGAEKLN
jgi:hypothetical protein